MIVGIHQPNFFPWLGFFDKLVNSDIFVLLDTVPYTKGGYQNRVQIKRMDGPQWLTIPVITKTRMGQATRDVEINHSVRWRQIHLQTFQTLYHKTPHYVPLINELSTLYENPTNKLVEVNISGILWTKEKLHINTPLVLASELGKCCSGSELLLELVRAVGGTTYLSGPSGRGYLDESLFSKAGVTVHYHHFTPFPYLQRFGNFVGGLSVLDYLFNVGPMSWW